MTVCRWEEIINLDEVSEITGQETERAILVFIDNEDKLEILRGKNCEPGWAVIPNLIEIINWIKKKKKIM